MLEVNVSPTLPEMIWNAFEQTPDLPCLPHEFLHGGAMNAIESRRSHVRIDCRGRAAMRHADSTSGVYTIDVSPKGMGFYSPVQLLPKQEVTLGFTQSTPLRLVVLRCRRIKSACYLCGSSFLDGPMQTLDYRDFIRRLELARTH